MIQELQGEAPVRHLCEAFDCPRSTYYYRSKRQDRSSLLAAIEQVLMHQPWFGYRRVVAQLQREGVSAGEAVVRRLLREVGHSRAIGQVRVRTTDCQHPYPRYSNLIRGMEVKQPNQVWVAEMV